MPPLRERICRLICVLTAINATACAINEPAVERKPAPVLVQILAINDFHGNLEPPTGHTGTIFLGSDPEGREKRIAAGGAAYLASHLSALRTNEPNTLFLSAGDLTGASPLISSLFHDEPTILVMNAMRLDANGVGNHEFDRGPSELLRMQNGGCDPNDGCTLGVPYFEGATFSYLAANVVDSQKQPILPAFLIREIGGVRIGIIGLTLKGTPGVTVPGAADGLRFADEVDSVNARVPELLSRDVSAVVVLLHQGNVPAAGTPYDGCGIEDGTIVDIAKRLDPRIDVIHSAHSHQAYNCMIADKLVTSAASFGRVISKIRLTIDPREHRVVRKDARNHLVTRDVEPDPTVLGIVEHYRDLASPIADRVVGHLEYDFAAAANAAGESPLGDLIADAMLDATSSAGAEIAFMNPGGIRADLESGAVTYAEAFTVQPFGNRLVTMTLSGAELKELLEEQWSGANRSRRILQVARTLEYAYRKDSPVGSKVDVRSLRIRGVPFDITRRYRVAVNTFLAAGGDGFSTLLRGKEVRFGTVDIDALLSYLKAHDPVPASGAQRIVAH